MAGVQLDNEDLWDDSALIRSWDEALTEYKRYHSIHARGENIEDVLNEFELNQLQSERDAQDGVFEQDEEYIQNVSVEENSSNDAVRQNTANRPNVAPSGLRDDSLNGNHPTDNSATGAAQKPPFAQAALASCQDDALKDVMLAWYYAGYYQAKYEYQQRARES
ncbi:hypothetical protein M501DRAFT_636749 [Patellaria atrata CBS 101060]|uniref:Survival Motor Neuron Gemin2-binding domain-containing protein n=1 Tax=Patellaria atrata CBS 101060 TaxID=1346257 RepID=A0A9P4SE42_9PEZI|nr:hypothetical protein M501DRAFT_636749 [Patellaria atrata CBS 101060]